MRHTPITTTPRTLSNPIATVQGVISVGEVRHRLLHRIVLARNRLRREFWSALARLPQRSRAVGCEELLPEDDTPAPFAGQPGAWDTYALRFSGDLAIEPKYGWILAGHTGLVDRPMPYYVWSRQFPNLSSQPPLLAVTLTPALRVDAVISLRILWEDNYYHYFNDVLARLRLVESLDIQDDVPIVLSAPLACRAYVRDSIARGAFGGRRVLIQPARTFVRARVVYSVDKRSGDRRDYDFFLDRLLPDGPGAGERRVLLVRSAKRGRSLTNVDDVRRLCERRDFEVVDTEAWSLADQIELFRNTRLIVGVHGAGLTNIIFRRGAPLTLLELIPPGPFPLSFNAVHDDESDYESLCRYFDFEYLSLQGTSAERLYKRSQNFEIDIDELAVCLDQLDESRGRRSAKP